MLAVRDRLISEKEVLQFLVERWVFSPNPLQHHRRVLFLFITVMREDRFEIIVLARIDPPVVPIHRLQFFHQGGDCAVHVPGFVREFSNWFVIAFVCRFFLCLQIANYA